MDSKFNIDRKISADATDQGTASNLNPNVTSVNPHFKDSKRVIKKMIVMDTSKLKGLGIESTIKNAMFKLGKGSHRKPEQPISKPADAQPKNASSKLLETVIKNEFEPKIASIKSEDTVIKQINRPGVPLSSTLSSTSNSMTESVTIQPNSMPIASKHQVVHLIRPSLPSAPSTNNVILQSVKSTTPSVPVVKKTVHNTPGTSTNRAQPLIVTSAKTIPIIKPSNNGPIQNNCNSKILKSDTTNNPIIKIEGTAQPLAAGDRKKIKILSNVSLNDAKAKLLEIDKLSSKNLKYTNVIKGTDKSSSTSTIHQNFNSGNNPEFTMHSTHVPVKVEVEEIPKFTNFNVPHSSGFPLNSTGVFSSTTSAKPFKSDVKMTASKNLKTPNHGMDKSTSQPTFHVSKSSVSAKSEDKNFTPKNLKCSSVAPKILNFSTVTQGITPILPARSSNTTSKPPKTTTIDNIPQKNIIFTNASTVRFTTSNSKPATPLYSSSIPMKTENDEIRRNDLNPPNYKVTKEFPLKTTVYNLAKKVTTACSTSVSPEVVSKQLASTDENIEIIIPSKQKYLKRDKSGMTERNPIDDATKPFQDVIWATNNPRTYARHNIKRLLSDKIIKKSRSQGESVENVLSKVDIERTSEIISAEETDKNESKCTDNFPNDYDLKSDKVESVLLNTEHVCSQSTPSTPASNPRDDSIQVLETRTASKDNFFGFSVDEVNESATVLSQIRSTLSIKRPQESPLNISTHPSVENVKDIETIDCDNGNWILNCETGVLEEQIDKNVTMVSEQPNVQSPKPVDSNIENVLVQDSNLVCDSIPTRPTTPETQVVQDKTNVLPSSISEASPTPSKISVIEDADDEISDIDLVRRSKGNPLTPSVKNRRAILKSIELHRKAFMSATTDDESELSLGVRPPRPKLRKSRQKQTVEQLKIQQNAHVSLLKRFLQTDSDCDNLNDESLVYFVDGMEGRIEKLENQVKCCFSSENCGDLNLEAVSLLSEPIVTNDTAPVTEENVVGNPSESVTETNDLVEPSDSLPSINTSLKCVDTCEEPHLDQPSVPYYTETADDDEGQSTIHEVTIQNDTFLVTQLNNQCDTINHLPLNVKLEKETSPKPSCLVNRSRGKKATKSSIRKKRKRKSLVEMLAQHVDQDTLKSVIIAHAKQKCDLSSSLDSDSENDSNGEATDVVSKIFRTVCTIDLCDDDDETLHEDVLQYLNDKEKNDKEIVKDVVSVTHTENMQTSNINQEHSDKIQPLMSSDEKLRRGKIKPETPESPMKLNETCYTISENSNENAQVSEEVYSTPVSLDTTSDVTIANPPKEKISSSPQATSNVSVMETESNNRTPFDDLHIDEDVAMPPICDLPKVDDMPDNSNLENTGSAIRVDTGSAPNDNISKLDDPQDTSIPKSTEGAIDVKTSSAAPTYKISELVDTPSPCNNITENPESSIHVEPDAARLNEFSKLDDMHDTSITNEPELTIDEKAAVNPLTDDVSKLDVELDTLATKEPKKTDKRKMHSEEMSSSAQSLHNLKMEVNVGKKLTFEETLAKADCSLYKESKDGTKRKAKVSKSKSFEKNEEKLLETSKQSNSIPETETPSKSKVKRSDEKIKYSSVSVNECSDGGAIKIKIKIGKDTGQQSSSIPISNEEILNGVSKPSSSRKRKAQVLEVPPKPAIPISIQSEGTRKRPIFDYFESPEILTTKRARKSKSYVDDDIPNDDVPSKSTSRRKSNVSNSSEENVLPKLESDVRKKVRETHNYEDTPKTIANQRTAKRKSKVPKSSEESIQPSKLESVVEENTEEGKSHKDPPTMELVEPVKVPVKDATVTENVSLTNPKSKRGVKPPVLAPINIANQYVCGNCKEEVEAKKWTKHMKSHYGLAWRVDVDPPIEMDNIHSMAYKVLNFTKKANIRVLKCPKCDVEKKSALGFLSHLEVCGLSPEEVKSKMVKCEHCPSMIRSCSMKTHLTFCSGLKRLLDNEKELNKEVEITEECYNEVGRAVRRSAQKAMSSFKDLGKPPEAKIEDYVERVHKISNKQHRKWRQLLKENNKIECVRSGCEFTANDMVTMSNHFNECVLVNGETFYCSRCEHGPDTRVAIEEHIKTNHSLGVIESIDDKDFSDSDPEAELGEESSESEGESGDEESEGENDGEECDLDDEDDDERNAKRFNKKRLREWAHNQNMLDGCLDRKVLSQHAMLLKSYTGGSYFQPALEWTQDFRDKHFSNKDLLPFATPNTFSVLKFSLTELYLPRISKSNKFFVKDVRKYRNAFGSTEINKSDNWKSLKRFEATKENNSIILFAGGPVLSMAWLPVPDDHLSQILAVCCRGDANEDILLNNTKSVKCLIQIWNFHKLKNGQLRQAQIPNLLYSIAYDHGPVIQMEFCPSGGFTEDRLGLLAVSSFDGHVDILALPKNFTCDNSTVENLVFTIQPSLTLCCELDRPLGVLITKLVWSQSEGHTKLAGGYSNGLVAIWNLKSLQIPHMCNDVDGIRTLLPTDLFFAANNSIRLLEFHHDEKNEARWLIAGSHNRKVKFFDTHNVYLEISTTLAHSRIVAGCWPMHWTTFLLGIDNAYSLKVSGILVKQPLNIGCRTGTFYSCIGSTCDISFNNWLNAYVFVTSFGDINVGYVRQMLSGFGETRRQRSVLGYTDSVDMNTSKCKEGVDIAKDNLPAIDEPQPSTSSVCTIEQCGDIAYPSTDGIVFCDFVNPLPAVTSPSYSKFGDPPMNTYNMVKVNRILFNPNVSAYKLYALGYESGFVRINQLSAK